MIVMLLYFKVADRYNIIDKPNERSSHSEVTIRGGGIIFLVASLFAVILHSEYWILVIGTFTIGAISFIDDRITLSNKIRLFFHLTAVTLLFLALNVFQVFSIYTTAALYVFVIGTINAYNFMDGINGITGVYSLIVFGGLQYVNYQVTSYVEPDLIWLPMVACLVFLFFNFRKRARCFAGDVGSITIAFWILFLLLKLMIQTTDISYILFLLIYGLDAATTIFFRAIRKENIFEAHRSHFYQFLANEKRISHLSVSAGYAFVQLLVILVLVSSGTISLLFLFVGIVLATILFISIRFAIEGRNVLLSSKVEEHI